MALPIGTRRDPYIQNGEQTARITAVQLPKELLDFGMRMHGRHRSSLRASTEINSRHEQESSIATVPWTQGYICLPSWNTVISEELPRKSRLSGVLIITPRCRSEHDPAELIPQLQNQFVLNVVLAVA